MEPDVNISLPISRLAFGIIYFHRLIDACNHVGTNRVEQIFDWGCGFEIWCIWIDVIRVFVFPICVWAFWIDQRNGFCVVMILDTLRWIRIFFFCFSFVYQTIGKFAHKNKIHGMKLFFFKVLVQSWKFLLSYFRCNKSCVI